MVTNTTSADSPKYSVIVPVFNESDNINPLYNRLAGTMRAMGGTYEIIFVDDGSRDGSFQLMKRLNSENANVKVVRFTRNFGQQAAIFAGLCQAGGQVVITIDADLQNPPEEIPRLIQKLDEGYEVALGVFKRPGEPIYRRAGSAFAKWVLAKTMPSIPTNLSGFRALKCEVVEQLKAVKEKNNFIDGMLCWMGFEVGVVEVIRNKRLAGKSKYNLFKLINLWFDMVVSFTNFPLKIAIAGGSLLGIIGFLLALFYFIRYLMDGSVVPGFATIVILLTVFSGVQLLCLGIMGEYIGRMNVEVKNKPQYVIREIIG
ncbi:MAG: glycosyltransferase family 2 protein [Dehalococcoidia bacterium]